MPIPPMFAQIPPQMYVNPSSFFPTNSNTLVDHANPVEIGKNVEKNT